MLPVHHTAPQPITRVYCLRHMYCSCTADVPHVYRSRTAPAVQEFRGAANLLELHAVLGATLMLRRTKAEVATQLPDKIRWGGGAVVWAACSTHVIWY